MARQCNEPNTFFCRYIFRKERFYNIHTYAQHWSRDLQPIEFSMVLLPQLCVVCAVCIVLCVCGGGVVWCACGGGQRVWIEVLSPEGGVTSA